MYCSTRFLAGGFLLSVLLAACGGGGGGGGTLPTGGGSPLPTPTNTTGPLTTNASGTVVDDANGQPLTGVSVKLMPWGNGPGTCSPTPAPNAITPESDGCPTPLPSPVATTDSSGNFTLNGAPNGHYILIVGSDTVMPVPVGYATTAPCGVCTAPTPAPQTPIQATVHDNVTLTGGNQVLKAATLPPVPTITPPAWETNGDYRLATLDSTTEMPCYIAWQYQRQIRSLPLGSVDEWLLENDRAGNTYFQTPGAVAAPWPGNAYGSIQTGNTQNNGGVACDASLVTTITFTSNPYATDLRANWFGGQYVYATGRGIASYATDPRSKQDPNVPTWP